MINRKEIEENTKNAIGFFPIPSGIAFVLIIIGNGNILNGILPFGSIQAVIVWLIMGFFFFTWVSLHYHSIEQKKVWIAYLFATIIWLYVGYEILISDHNPVMVFFKSFFLTFAFLLSYIYVPFLKQRNQNLKILFQVHQLRYALFRTLLFIFLLSIALVTIHATLYFLFGIEMRTFLVLIGFNIALAVFVYNFLSTLMVNPNEVQIDIQVYKAMVSRYLLWLLYAFTVIIFTALNLFVFKMVVTQELPKGKIAWMVMGFTIFAFSTYLSLLPYKEKIKKYNTLLWGTLALQSLVLLGSISIRIYEYGVTEKRYLLVAYGLWLFFISLYFLWKKTKAKIFWLFSTLSVVILLSQIGPMNGYSMSRASQQTQLGVLYENFQKVNEKEQSKAFNRLYNVIEYLRDTHGHESVIEVIPELTKENMHGHSTLWKTFGLKASMMNDNSGDVKNVLTFYENNDKVFDVYGYDYFLKRIGTDSYPRTYILKNKVKCTIQIVPSTLTVQVTFNGDRLNTTVEPLLKKLEESNSPPKEQMVLIMENEEMKLRLEFFQIRYYVKREEFTGFANLFVDLKETK